VTVWVVWKDGDRERMLRGDKILWAMRLAFQNRGAVVVESKDDRGESE
jgi:CO dehydrogenase/acetyl-CoA synthase gamma subunit (corrinoid Fe-S protein)